MKKVVYFLHFILLLQTYVNAQSRDIDSLNQMLLVEKTDTGKVALLNKLSRSYSRFNPDTALVLAQHALSLATETGFIKGQAGSLMLIGNAFQRTGNYPKALMFFLESLNKAESINDKSAIATASKGIYVNYSSRGDERQAVNYALQTVAVNVELKDSNALALDMLNLSDGYMILNDLDSAKWYNNQGYNFAIHQKNALLTGFAFNNFGNIYLKAGQDNEALTYYKLSLPYIKEARSDEDLCSSYLGISKIFRAKNIPDSCLYYARLALAAAKEGNFTKSLLNVYNLLTDYYASVHNIDSAFVYQSAAIAANDSLFNQEKTKEIQALTLDEAMRQRQINEAKIHYQNQVKFYLLLGGIFCMVITAFLLYRNNRHKQKVNVLLASQKEKVEETLKKLKSTQAQLIQSEKMASLGELTAGIAHEIQNPLNFVNNFSEVNKELTRELVDEVTKGNIDEAKLIAADIQDNSEKINHHGKRADAIVKGMLEHSRNNSGQKEPTDINSLCDEYLRLAYHGLRVKDKAFNATLETHFDNSLTKVLVMPQEIGRVILNIINNAFYAINEKTKRNIAGYEPTVTVKTLKFNGPGDKSQSLTGSTTGVEIRIIDNGDGIPQNILDKIFQPFFTTKPTGQGTGLGLSLAYDIVTKGHGGELTVETKEGKGTVFIIKLNQ